MTWLDTAIAALMAAVGTGGGAWGLVRVRARRHEQTTGRAVRDLAARVEAEREERRAEIQQMEERLTAHLDAWGGRFERALERTDESLRSSVGRLEIRVDGLYEKGARG